MGKRKAAKAPGARRRQCGLEADAQLPAIDSLRDLPAFADLRIDDAQRAAFDAFRADWLAAAGAGADGLLQMGCVIRLDRGFPLVAAEGVTLRAEHAVAFAKRDPERETLLPAVGDWVVVRVDPVHDKGVIECVLPRRTAFERWRGKNRGDRQTLAANVDVIFIVQPLGAERDAGSLMRDRIARSLVLVRDCGAEPVVVFTKADRCDAAGIERAVADARVLAGREARVIVSSSAAGTGLDEILSCVPEGACGMILGESGAGKSTLLNALLGHEALATGDVRERDDMGRHTTVARVMCKLPGPYGVIADAPGLRSLPLVGHDLGLARTFPDIARAARGCRFNDCSHTHEPGCAVREAVDEGLIDEIRVEAFLALAREMRVSAQSLDPDVKL
ncbi:MAG: ribosome small subunit-dependent GTPase A [Collinsella sp.]|nr:ribosome small subunit-dependent GTPase A [Collinsella sp.]